ncbi:nck-associated protein 1 homolog [Halichondria panicea]|uniref:nck-associated protein 1 homolog n=1 Tax=Halichondria panicea TaxID=6063 RepID=UPI00312BCABF
MAPPKSKHRPNPDDYSDSALPELLFNIAQLKTLVNKHHRVILNYYLRYMSGFDAQLMRNVVMGIQVCPEEESLLMTSFVDTLARLQGKENAERPEFDFQALRLDWFRFQCLTSVNKAALSLKDNENGSLAPAMNGVVVHSKMVDNFQELLIEQTDLSFMCFFYRQFENEFNRCMKNLSQVRYIIAFPVIRGEFLNSTSPFCPEERINIGDRAVNSVNHFLELIAKEVKLVLGQLSSDRMNLDDQLKVANASSYYNQTHAHKLTKKKAVAVQTPSQPGEESYRRTREETVRVDSVLQTLVGLSFSVNCFPSITAWEHTFVPREYLVSHLEDLFMKHVVSMLSYNSETQEIARPSEVLARIESYMASLRTLELYVNIDMTRVLTAVLLQETQPLDSKGESTIASAYTGWYTNTLLKRVAAGGICYSRSRRCFVSKGVHAFKAEEFTDLRELEALAAVIGPYGIRFLGEKLMDQVSGQVKEIKKLVVANQDSLHALHSNRDKPEIYYEVIKKVKSSEDLLARTVIVGIIMAFRKLTLVALNNVLSQRVPFILSSIVDFKQNLPDKTSTVADQMAIAAGVPCDVDPLLYSALRSQCDKSKEDHMIWSLYMVFLGVTLPDLAFKPDSTYLPFFEGHENNAHCLAVAITSLPGAIFAYYGDKEQKDRMKEFLVFTSSRIMTLAKETEKEKDAPKAREAIYLLLDLIVEESPFLTRDLLESCFPYALLRDAYSTVYKNPATTNRKQRDSETPF